MVRVVSLPPENGLEPDGSRVAGWWEETAEPGQVHCRLCPRLHARAGRPRLLFRPPEPRGPAGLDHLRPQHGVLRRPDREEAAPPVPPGQRGALLRHARLQPGLPLLPELDDHQVARRGGERASRPPRKRSPRPRSGSAARAWPSPTTTRSSGPNMPATRRRPAAAAACDGGRHFRLHEPRAARGLLRAHRRGERRPQGFQDDFYRRLAGGRLEPVLDTLRWLAHKTEVWLEITNLLIPGRTMRPPDIERMCRWIHDELGPDVPLHFSAFHPDFRMTDYPPTPPATLSLRTASRGPPASATCTPATWSTASIRRRTVRGAAGP